MISTKKQKPKAETPKTQVDTIEWEHHKRCVKLAQEIESLDSQYRYLKDQAKEVGSELKTKQSRLARMTAKGPEKLPLFDAAKKAVKKTEEEMPLEGGWRIALLANVLDPKADKSAIQKFEDAGVRTVGEFEDLRSKHANGDWFTAISGIGRAKADKIETKLLDWIAQNQTDSDAKPVDAPSEIPF